VDADFTAADLDQAIARQPAEGALGHIGHGAEARGKFGDGVPARPVDNAIRGLIEQ